MFSVAICDDEPIICTQFEKALVNYKEEQINLDMFFTGEELIKSLVAGNYYDLIFLDIELGHINGVEVGKLIRDTLDNEKTQIVYISSKQEYAMELFEIRPMNFLIKPIDRKTILQNINKAIKLSGEYEKIFEFKYDRIIHRIPYTKILYFESRGRKTYIHSSDFSGGVYAKLDEIEISCPKNFTRIHQSYLINNIYISKYRSDSIVLTNGVEVPISKKYKKTVNQLMLENEGVLN